jgi:hypothetical protein
VSDAQVAPTPAIALRRLGWGAPFAWLRAGWHDFRRHPGIGLCYGACFIAMGAALLQVVDQAAGWRIAV